MMDNNRINYLYDNYLAKNLTKQEFEEFKAAVMDPIAEAHFKFLLDERWERLQIDELPEVPKEIDKKVYEHVRVRRTNNKNWLKPHSWIAAAAAAIVIIVFAAGLFYYSKNSIHDQHIGMTYKNDVAPGKSGATLTLSSGRRIRLTEIGNGELAKEAGVAIKKSASGQLVYEIQHTGIKTTNLNTLSTAKGETYQIKLPDGSRVWLNTASSLTYSPNLYDHGKRRVRLSGEAYFEIAKDKSRPFVVESEGQEVEVLGTHFNVNAYKDESVLLTTLLEGSVKVTSGGRKQLLRPGQQALNNGNSIQVVEANLENVTDWKEGDFFLDRVNFKLAMRKIARWYDVEIIYADDVPDELEAGGWISRDNKLSTVLNSIEKSGIVHFKIEGRKIYIYK
jgi:transmembrane sensor